MGKIKKRYFFDGTEYLAKVHVVSEKIHKKMGKVLFHKKRHREKGRRLHGFGSGMSKNMQFRRNRKIESPEKENLSGIHTEGLLKNR